MSKQKWYNGSLYSVSHYSLLAGLVLRPSTLEFGLRFFSENFINIFVTQLQNYL